VCFQHIGLKIERVGEREVNRISDFKKVKKEGTERGRPTPGDDMIPLFTSDENATLKGYDRREEEEKGKSHRDRGRIRR
jgi:hypothetical protein